MAAFQCPQCGKRQELPLAAAACPRCGQAFPNAVGPAADSPGSKAAVPPQAAALLLQCLGQALLKGAVTALGAALAPSAEATEAGAPGLQLRREPATSGQDDALAGVEAPPFGGTAALAGGNTAYPDAGRVVDAVFGAAEEDGLPDVADNPATLSGTSGGDGQRRAEAALSEGLTVALQELQRGGLVDSVRALWARAGTPTPPAE